MNPPPELPYTSVRRKDENPSPQHTSLRRCPPCFWIKRTPRITNCAPHVGLGSLLATLSIPRPKSVRLATLDKFASATVKKSSSIQSSFRRQPSPSTILCNCNCSTIPFRTSPCSAPSPSPMPTAQLKPIRHLQILHLQACTAA